MKSILKFLLASVGLGSLVAGPVLAQTEIADLPDFASALADTANWREVDPDNLILMKIVTSEGVSRGEILIETADFASPRHTAQFKAIVKSGDYNGTVFHRVIGDFMAQGGDIAAANRGENPWPTIEQEFQFARDPSGKSAAPKADIVTDVRRSYNDSQGFPGPKETVWTGYISGFPLETQNEALAFYRKDGVVQSWLPHCKGMVSSARTSDPNSASAQFFLMRETSHHLDRQYTPWGRIVDGQEVVDSIKTGEPVVRPDVLVKAVMVSDLAEGQRPRVLVQRTDGPAFAPVIEAYKLALKADETSDICSHPSVPTIVQK